MSRKKHRKEQEFVNDVCAFCGNLPDEKKCGKFFTSKFGFSVHQYCMFFSAALPQNGNDDEGFEGFLEQDVLKEVRRAGRLKCAICGIKGASAGCCDLHCKKGFHFPCGVDNKYLFQFFGQFRAYCGDHRLHQKTKSHPKKKASCPICLETVQCHASPDILTTPCCKDVWLHRSCVQEQATVSGYFFRCAVCNDTNKFVEEMKRMGIYVPDRDAAWEDGNNFAELLEKYNHCDHPICKCPMGRKYSVDSGKWELVLCSSCGQFGTHVACKKWDTYPPLLLCPTCRPAHENNPPAVPPCVIETLPSIQEETIAKSTVNRKGKGHLRKKRQHVDSSDTDSDDILNVVNGLKRQAADDFLNSDTSFFVQRAIAAGTAAMQRSGLKKFRANESATPMVSKVRLPRDEGAESDDEIVITKYVPGQRSRCEICPKCNKKKPLVKSSGQVFRSTGTSSTVGKSSGATSTITKADMEREKAGHEFVLKRGKQDIGYGKRNAEGRDIRVADYEVLELAAERTNESSVLLMSSDDKSNGPVGIMKPMNGENEKENKAVKSSSWLSSVEKLFNFLNPDSRPEAKKDSKSEVKSRRLTEQQDDDDYRDSVTFSNVEIDNETLGCSESETTGELSALFGRTSESVGWRSVSVREKSETTRDWSKSRAKTSETNPGILTDGNANLLKFPNSAPTSGKSYSRNDETASNKDYLVKKVVLEAVIDHAKELKNSGKEHKQGCLSC